MSSENNLKLVNEEELQSVTNITKTFLPESLTIYGLLSAGFKYKTIEKEQTKVYIPEKDSTFFIAITGVLGKAQFPSLSIYWKVGSISNSVIVNYLLSLKEINWKQPVGFAACEEHVLKELESILSEELLCGNVLKRYKADILGAYWMKGDNVVPTYSLPENFELGEIHLEDADKVIEVWQCSVVEAANNFETMIQNLPSSAVFYCAKDSSTRKMVAWTVTRHSGEIGMTYTLPEFRNRKLATIITCDLVKKHRKLGLIPNVTMDDDNLASIAIHKMLGLLK